MAEAVGEVIETPTEEMPFKAVIEVDGETIQERFFASRVEAEVFLVATLKGLTDGTKHGAEGI
jgi:hypothetical protein